MSPEEKEVLRLYNERNGTSHDESNWIENVNWQYISASQTLSEDFVERHAGRLNWPNISSYQTLSEDFMERYADRLNWRDISYSQSLSEAFMERHAERLDWRSISAFQFLSEPFIERHAERLSWSEISIYQSLSEDFMERHAERLDWWGISYSQSLSEAFIERHAERLNWQSISYSQSLSEEFMERHVERLDWRSISAFQFLSEPFIERHIKRLPEGFRSGNWLYVDRETKIRHIREKAPEFVLQEDEGGPFIVAWKATRSGGRSSHRPTIVYAVGETYSAHCDCRMDVENSFGLSGWTEEGARGFVKKGEFYRVKIYVDDIGAMVHDGKKIRCRRQTFLEKK